MKEPTKFLGLADFNSVFLHEVPLLFRSGAVKLNAISPPDDSGYCTLGRNVDATRAAITHADHITAISNKNILRTFGNSVIRQSDIDVIIEMDHPLYKEAGSFQEKKIGEIIANNLADNDATLQTG
ncbi:hypothetical protein WUBG_17265 [Wuchereria bancrofti]|uniref:Uncharacterized protein n=1 Tax=Wuchereria bancrofti TaxID=6293 RepID=J9DQA9_WUCBA|nr:hypothetical protein WUBG_17265 [Wuchereria bancrofti]